MPSRRKTPAIAACLALCLSMATAPVWTRDIVASAGVSNTSNHDYVAAAAFIDGHGQRRQHGRLTWQPIFSLGWVDNRHRERLDEEVIIAAGGIRLVDWWRRAFVSFQFGYAHDTTDALSSHGQFLSSIGWQGERVVFTLRHVSNGKVFGGRNLGETMLLAGVRF